MSLQLQRIVDLTQELSNDMPLFPGMARPSFQDIAVVARDGYGMSEWHQRNHIGTHVDAPTHLVEGETLDDIPLERLVTTAVVLDFSRHARGPLTRQEIEPSLEHIQRGDIVLIYSGGSRYWGTEQYWSGWCYPDAQAAQALIDHGVSGIGFDGPSADPVNLTDPENVIIDLHRLWLGSGRLLFENLTNLDQLPEHVLLVVAPIKVRGANGAPARILALIF